MTQPSLRAATCLVLTVMVWGCGSVQLPAALTPAERAEVEAASIPAVVGIERSGGRRSDDDLLRILRGSGLFSRVEWLTELDEEPDLVGGVRRHCEENPTNLTPLFTWLTLGVVPTWIRDRYGFSFVLFDPEAPSRRVEIGCGPRRTYLFGWLGTPLNILPGWTLGRPEEHPRYARQVELEVVRAAEAIRRLLAPGG